MAGFPDPTQTTTPAKDDRPIILIGGVVASLLQREAPSEPVLVTTYGIEYGEEIADYAIDLTKTLVLDCKFLSDYVGPGVNVSEYSRANGGRKPTTWQEKRDAILAYKAGYTPINVFTGYRLYESMVITDYALNRTPATSESWTVQLFFQHIEYIKSQWSVVPIDRIPVDKRSEKIREGSIKGKGKKAGGERPGSEVDEQQADDYESWFIQLGVKF